MSMNVWVKCGRVYNLVAEDGVTTTTTGNGLFKDAPKATMQASVAGTGSVSATVLIDFSNDNANWINGGTITLSGTTSATDGFTTDASWKYVRARVTAVSGTGATVKVLMGV